MKRINRAVLLFVLAFFGTCEGWGQHFNRGDAVPYLTPTPLGVSPSPVSPSLTKTSTLSDGFQLSLPEGWVNVTEDVAQANSHHFRGSFLSWAKNPKFKLTAVCFRTLGVGFPVFLVQPINPISDHRPFDDGALMRFQAWVPISLRGDRFSHNATILENEIKTVNGIKIVRAIVEAHWTWNGNRILARSAHYFLPDGKGATQIVFWAPRNDWESYLAVFDDIVSGSLHR